MRYHLIAIGGAVMHNVAIDLLDMGHQVTGSDDEIYNPSRARLEEYGLLPSKMGWFPDQITEDIDTIILGKHAKSDNPELKKAIEFGIPILSFPEFIAQSTIAKHRVCVAGSHGKTTTTSMIMHALAYNNLEFDYLVGANLKGFKKMVKLSNADILVVEGDEYPSSCLDNRAKMLHYHPNISIITGLEWDHVNIYKTYEDYKASFRTFLSQMSSDAICFFDQTDEALRKMNLNEAFNCTRKGYTAFETDKKGQIVFDEEHYPIQIFGRHNMKNLKAAYHVCKQLGMGEKDFFSAMSEFTGAAKRLEKIFENENITVFKDFAHAPSKCKATVAAVRERFPNKKVKGLLELHTFSSLSADFLPHYNACMNGLDEAGVFYDPHALEMKQMPALDPDFVKTCFGDGNIQVFDASDACHSFLDKTVSDGTEVLLLMSSGNIGSYDLEMLKNRLN